MTQEEEINAASQRGQELFDELVANESRSSLLWLCSYLRRWDFAAWNFTPDEMQKEQEKAALIWNRSNLAS